MTKKQQEFNYNLRKDCPYWDNCNKRILNNFADKIKKEIRDNVDLEDLDEQYHQIIKTIDKILKEKQC